MNGYGLYIEANFGYLPRSREVNQSVYQLFGARLIDEREMLLMLARNLFEEASRRLKRYVWYNRSFKNKTFNLHDAFGCFVVIDGKKSDDLVWQPPQRARERAYQMNYETTNIRRFNLSHRTGRAQYETALARGGKRVGSKNTRLFYANKYHIMHHYKDGSEYVNETGAYANKSKWGWNYAKYAFVEEKQRIKGSRNQNYLSDRPKTLSGGEEFRRFFRTFQTQFTKGITLVVANPMYYAVFLESKRKRVLYGFSDIVKQMQREFGDLRLSTARFHYTNEPIGSARTEEFYKKVGNYESYIGSRGLVNPEGKYRKHIVTTTRGMKQQKKHKYPMGRKGHEQSHLMKLINLKRHKNAQKRKKLKRRKK